MGWGQNSNGQTTVPAPNTGFVSVAAGGSHSLGLKADGSIMGWGRPTAIPHPQLPDANGDGLVDLRDVAILFAEFSSTGYPPDVLSDFDEDRVIDIADLRLLVAAMTGPLPCPELPEWEFLSLAGEPCLSTHAHATSLGYSALKAVRLCDRDDTGRTLIASVVSPADGQRGVVVCAEEAEQYYFFKLNDDGTVQLSNEGGAIIVDPAGSVVNPSVIVAWGNNSSGQRNVPAPNTGFVGVAAGGNHSLGLKADGSIFAWGCGADTNYGQCTVPAPNSDFVAVAAGRSHSLGLKADGTIVAWGCGPGQSLGQCNVPAPNTGFVSVAAGGWHSLGLKADGSIVAWGYNGDGQTNVPPPNMGFVGVAAGESYSLGLKADGSIVAWGSNDFGQTIVPAPNTGFVSVAAGGSHSLGLWRDGATSASIVPTEGLTMWHSLGVGRESTITATMATGPGIGQCAGYWQYVACVAAENAPRVQCLSGLGAGAAICVWPGAAAGPAVVAVYLACVGTFAVPQCAAMFDYSGPQLNCQDYNTNDRSCDVGSICSAPNSGVCRYGVCTGGIPANEGANCTSQFRGPLPTCRGDDIVNQAVCTGGQCRPGAAVSCGEECMTCDRFLRGCVPAVFRACDDDIDCTVSDRCQNGSCRSTPHDARCGNQDNSDADCILEFCHETQGCVGTPEPFNSPCDDEIDCTTHDRCNGAGGCFGSPNNSRCPQPLVPNTFCWHGFCSLQEGGCEIWPILSSSIKCKCGTSDGRCSEADPYICNYDDGQQARDSAFCCEQRNWRLKGPNGHDRRRVGYIAV